MPKPTKGRSRDKRRTTVRPPQADRERILAIQENRCIYCNNEFDSFIERGDDLEPVVLSWDHFLPFAYTQSNEVSNLFAACRACNSIKGNLIYESIEDAVRAICKRRWEKGYRL